MKLVPVHISRWRLPKTTSLSLPPIRDCYPLQPRCRNAEKRLPGKNLCHKKTSRTAHHQSKVWLWLAVAKHGIALGPTKSWWNFLGKIHDCNSTTSPHLPNLPTMFAQFSPYFSNHLGHLVLHYHHAAGVADGTLQEGSLSCHRTSAELRRPHGTPPMFVEWGSYGGFPKQGYPQIIHFSRTFHYERSIWGTPIPGNPHIWSSFSLLKWQCTVRVSQCYHHWICCLLSLGRCNS